MHQGRPEGKPGTQQSNKASKRQRFGSYVHMYQDDWAVTATQQAVTSRGGNSVVDSEVMARQSRARCAWST